MDALAHSLAGWLWLFVWLSAALAFIRSERRTRSVAGWMKRVAETGIKPGDSRSKRGLLLSVAVFTFLGFCVCVFLLFLTPALMVGCLLGTLRKGGKR